MRCQRLQKVNRKVFRFLNYGGYIPSPLGWGYSFSEKSCCSRGKRINFDDCHRQVVTTAFGARAGLFYQELAGVPSGQC